MDGARVARKDSRDILGDGVWPEHEANRAEGRGITGRIAQSRPVRRASIEQVDELLVEDITLSWFERMGFRKIWKKLAAAGVYQRKLLVRASMISNQSSQTVHFGGRG